MRRVIALLFALCLAHPASAEPLTVFAAASLRGALDDALAAWPQGEPPRTVYAGTSTLARQLRDGAPADIFIAANAAWMDALQVDAVIAPETRRALLGNTLVLLADRPGAVAPDALPQALGDERIALGLVDAVPAGLYARQALKAYGVWDAVRPAVVQVSNVRIALALVNRGETAFAITYATDARLAPDAHVAFRFPANTHAPIVYPAAALTGAAPEAHDLLAWLSGSEAQAIFARHGFAPPP